MPDEARRLAHARAAHRPAEARRRDGRARPSRSSNAPRLPALRRRSTRSVRASSSAFTPTIDALVTPDIDASLDEQAREDALLERVQGARRLVGRAPAVLAERGRRAAALVAAARGARRVGRLRRTTCRAIADRWDVALVAAVVCPGDVRRRRGSCFPLADERWLLAAALAVGALAALLDLAGLDAPLQRREARRLHARSGSGSVQLLEALLLGRPRRRGDPVGRHRRRSTAGRPRSSSRSSRALFERIAVSRSRVPGEDGAARPRPPDVIFFALFLAAARPLRAARRRDVDRDDGRAVDHADRDVRRSTSERAPGAARARARLPRCRTPTSAVADASRGGGRGQRRAPPWPQGRSHGSAVTARPRPRCSALACCTSAESIDFEAPAAAALPGSGV